MARSCLVPNPCEGAKPTAAGFDNHECIIDGLVQAVEQSGTNVTRGYQGLLETSAEPINTTYSEAGLCPVNVHWHLGAEHLSVGEYDENGSGPSEANDHGERQGFQCLHYEPSNPIYTTPYAWQHCSDMEVGQTYEVHWPHSKGGDCGTIHQYQTPFYDGVFCNAGLLAPTTQEAIGVQSQTFVIVNDETYYHDNLFDGMITDGVDFGTDLSIYTGSTTGTSRSNEICSAYGPITWQVDRKCHPISASSFDKMCEEMKLQHDDMSGDTHPHGSRELVADILAANNHRDGSHRHRRSESADSADSCACLEQRICDATAPAFMITTTATTAAPSSACSPAPTPAPPTPAPSKRQISFAGKSTRNATDDGLTGGAIVAIVVGVIFAIGIICIFCVRINGHPTLSEKPEDAPSPPEDYVGHASTRMLHSNV